VQVVAAAVACGGTVRLEILRWRGNAVLVGAREWLRAAGALLVAATMAPRPAVAPEYLSPAVPRGRLWGSDEPVGACQHAQRASRPCIVLYYRRSTASGTIIDCIISLACLQSALLLLLSTEQSRHGAGLLSAAAWRLPQPATLGIWVYSGENVQLGGEGGGVVASAPLDAFWKPCH
jgi:hypothetical protein